MSKIILTKTTLITAFIIVSLFSSCKHFIVRSGGFEAPDETGLNAPVKFLSSGLVSSTEEKIKQMVTAVTLSSAADNVGRDNASELLVLPALRDRELNAAVLTVSYSEANTSARTNVSKAETWIICKPQFIRVRPEGVDREKNIVETLF